MRDAGDSVPHKILPRSAFPFRGSPQCAHWGMGSPGADYFQAQKDTTSLDSALSFSPRQSLNLGDPSVGFADSSPKGAPRVRVQRCRLSPCRGALPLLGEVARSADGVSMVGLLPIGKGQHRSLTSPCLFRLGTFSSPATPQSAPPTAPLKGRQGWGSSEKLYKFHSTTLPRLYVSTKSSVLLDFSCLPCYYLIRI